MSQSRQLAAIMFTDIVGYTKLMGEDEQKAFELLKKNRAVQRPIIEKFNGRWLKEIGDGVLASFTTVSEAVYCAKAIQEACLKENDLKLRIGIHLGEVVFEGNDVFGDGVNIASRLEPLAPVGGILVSESVHKNLLNKKDIQSNFVGEKHLKNVRESVRVYQVQVEGLTPTLEDTPNNPIQSSIKLIRSRKMAFAVVGVIVILLLTYVLYTNQIKTLIVNEPQIETIDKSIAVLPFKNWSNDPDMEPFCNGMTDAVISRLTKIGSIAKVISQSSMLKYKETNKSIPEIANELGVTHILDGSFQISGNQVKVSLKLIDGPSDNHIWSENYLGEWDSDDIFKIQSEVAENVAENMELEITASEIESIQKIPTTNLEAYRIYQQGQYFVFKASQASFDTAIILYKKAISLDPEFALAYAALSRTYILNIQQDPNPKLDEKSYVAFQKALTIDPNLAEGYVAKANWHWTANNKFDHENTILAVQKAIELKPGISNAYEMLAIAQFHVGLYEQALHNIRKGLEIEPTNQSIRHIQAAIHLYQGKYAEALNKFKTVEDYVQHLNLRITYMVQSLFYLDDMVAAEEMINNGLIKFPNEAQLNSCYAIILASQGRYDEAKVKMSLALENEKPDREIHHLYHNLAGASALMGEDEEAVKWLIKAAEIGLPNYPLFNRDPNLASLKGNPDFESFMVEMKKEWEYYKSL